MDFADYWKRWTEIHINKKFLQSLTATQQRLLEQAIASAYENGWQEGYASIADEFDSAVERE